MNQTLSADFHLLQDRHDANDHEGKLTGLVCAEMLSVCHRGSRSRDSDLSSRPDRGKTADPRGAGLQGSGRHGMPSGPRSPPPRRGLLATLVSVATEEGFRKLWHGLPPALCRRTVYSGCRMSCYETLRETVLMRNPDGTFPLRKASLSGAYAGAMGQLLPLPPPPLPRTISRCACRWRVNDC